MDLDLLNFWLYFLKFEYIQNKEYRKFLNILAVFVIFRRESDSLFVAVVPEAAAAAAVVLTGAGEVLPLVCLFSFELAAKDKI